MFSSVHSFVTYMHVYRQNVSVPVIEQVPPPPKKSIYGLNHKNQKLGRHYHVLNFMVDPNPFIITVVITFIHCHTIQQRTKTLFSLYQSYLMID